MTYYCVLLSFADINLPNVFQWFLNRFRAYTIRRVASSIEVLAKDSNDGIIFFKSIFACAKCTPGNGYSSKH